MSKKMTLNNLQSQVNREYKARKILIDGYEVVIEPKFKPSKIENLLVELDEKEKYTNENGLFFNIIDYVYILLIKYFTDIRMTDDYENQIKVMKALIDLGYLEKIITEFEQSEVDKITRTLKNGLQNLKEVLKAFKEVEDNAEL